MTELAIAPATSTRTKPSPTRGQADLEMVDGLVHEIIRLNRLFERAAAQYHAQHPDGIERAAYILLVHLIKGGPQRASALADAVFSDPSTVSRQVSQLVRAGLVERRADPGDGRATLLAATPAGEETFQRWRKRRIEHFAAMLADWSVEDRRTLHTLLDRFNTDFENDRAAAAAASPRAVRSEPTS